jgi:hypothetical protein
MKAVVVVAAVLLTGCCTKPHYPTVPVSCVKSTPERSPSLFDSIGADDDIAEQVRALLIDRDVTEIYVGGLEALVAGCR